jgi:hypothetical protein
VRRPAASLQLQYHCAWQGMGNCSTGERQKSALTNYFQVGSVLSFVRGGSSPRTTLSESVDLRSACWADFFVQRLSYVALLIAFRTVRIHNQRESLYMNSFWRFAVQYNRVLSWANLHSLLRRSGVKVKNVGHHVYYTRSQFLSLILCQPCQLPCFHRYHYLGWG